MKIKIIILLCLILLAVPMVFSQECGDGICESEESCPVDCMSSGDALCGNDICEDGEDINNCNLDCFETIPDVALCGNDICEEGENINNCPSDCSEEGIEDNVTGSEEGFEENLSDSEDTASLEEGFNVTDSEEGIESNESTNNTEDFSDQIKGTTFFSSLAFKIIIVILVLIIVGVIVFIIYYKRKMSNQIPEENSQNI